MSSIPQSGIIPKTEPSPFPAFAFVATMRFFLKQIPILFLAILASDLHALAGEQLKVKSEEEEKVFDRCDDPNPPKLQSFEPNTVGITSDSNDVPFLDLKMSLEYPLFHKGMDCGKKRGKWGKWVPYFYMAGTVRFAQYSDDDRHSSPVIGKRFNPMVFGRYWFGELRREKKRKKGKYYYGYERKASVDIGYAHESNGQKVDTEAEYLALKASNPENPDFANDFLSRGWDYIFFAPKLHRVFNDDKWSSYGIIKYFPNRSFPQGKNEEYNVWENARAGENFKRRIVDGMTFSLTHKTKWLDLVWCFPFFCKTTGSYTTGYARPLKYSTVRIETVAKFNNLPFMLWWANGYNSDLTDYFRRVNSFGVALELSTFD